MNYMIFLKLILRALLPLFVPLEILLERNTTTLANNYEVLSCLIFTYNPPIGKYGRVKNQSKTMAPDPLQLQYFHVTTFRSIGTSMSNPGAALVAHGPLQYCQITSTGGITACYTIPWTALATGPLQYFQVTTTSGRRSCYTIPVQSQLLDHCNTSK